ncbi:MAG: CoA transferase [Actinomycetota bacterium]
MTAQAPLDGVRVVELAQGIAGPYAGKLLADYGADVIKVEPGGGDVARTLGPFPDGADGDPEQSATFLHLNTNKRSVVLDDRDGGDLLDGLLAGADVVIQSSPEPNPGELRARFPGLVVASVTPFGLTGPLAGYAGEEIVHYAFGGPMSATGSAEREPIKMGGAVGQYQCGSVAAVSILAALALAESSGDGVHIDLANVETQVCSIDRRMTYVLYATYRGSDVERTGGYRVSPLPGGCRPTAEGHIQISTLMNWIPRMLAVVDNPDLAEIYTDPGFLVDEDVPDVIDAHILGWTLTKTKQEAMEEAQAGGWPITAVNRPIDLLDDAHFVERGFFVPVEHPVAGTVRQPGAPIRIADGWALRRPAPLLGEHTDEVRADLQPIPAVASAAEPAPDRGSSGGSPVAGGRTLPLAGVRILDMTVVWAGPYATWILADLGAEIIRVDNPWIFPSATRGVLPRPTADMVADIGGIFGGYPDAEPGLRPWNRIALFNAHARGKRSITLDLRKDAGRETLLRLAEQCDLMIENNSVDLVDKLGIGWEALHERNPELSLIRMPSVGLTGPYRDYLGFGVNFEGLCGLTSLRGYRDDDLSESETVFHMDAASGSAGALAALMALRRTERTGVGEMIELSQSENMMNHIGELFIDADRTGREHVPLGNRHHLHAPQGCYPCRDEHGDDDAWAVVSVVDDDRWRVLAGVMGRPELADDPRFATAADRRANHDELDELLAGWTRGLTANEVFHACQGAGVAAAPVLRELEALADPHLQARNMFAETGSDETGRHLHPTHLWHWDGPDLAWGPLPVLGGDNESVLKGIAGLSDDEYTALAADGHLSLDYLDQDGNPL